LTQADRRGKIESMCRRIVEVLGVVAGLALFVGATPAVAAVTSYVISPHIMEVVGGGSGIAYVGWLSSSNPQGYAAYLRTFSVTRGWLSDPLQVSSEFGATSVWPGDTLGISTLSPNDVVLSWGSATSSTGKQSEIFAAHVRARLH
jgi:hypothetical protein